MILIRSWRAALFWLFSIGFGCAIAVLGIAKPASNSIYDNLLRFNVRAPSKDLVIVAIDDESLSRIGSWPWKRTVHARMIDRLVAAHPREILYDVLFTEPSTPDDDKTMAIAMAKAPPIALPLLFEVPGRDGHPVSVKHVVATINAPNISFGHVVLSVDEDGLSRKVKLAERVDGKLIPHVAVPAGRLVEDKDTGPLRIAFAPRGAIQTIPFVEVLEGHVPPSLFAGKTVIVGATAPGLGDRYATPATQEGALTPGVEILANVVGNIHDNKLIVDSGTWGVATYIALSTLVLALGFAVFGPLTNVALTIASACLMLATSAVFLGFGVWVDPAPALLAMVVLFPAWGWLRLHAATRAVGRQLSVLEVSTSLLHLVDAAPASLASGGDWLNRQLATLDLAIERNIELRRFVQVSFDSLPDAAMVFDERGKTMLANQAALALFDHYAVSPVPESARRVLRALMLRSSPSAAALREWTGKRSQDREIEVHMDDDRYLAISRGTFVSDAGRTFVIVRLVEMTRQRHAERDREHALEFLSHDLRGPQASILALLDGHRNAIEPSLLGRLQALATKTLSMAQAFIDIARAKGGAVDVATISMNDVVREVVDGMWNDFRRKGVAVVITTAESDPAVDADPLLVSRAIENLVTNALRFSPAGSTVRVRISRRQHASGENFVACLIDDSGPGIERHTLQAIFTRFQTSDRSGGGTGLGLAMVDATIRRFKGKISVYSRKELGSRFVFELPVSDRD
jgi:CHASE2 domain-containing sensor protein/signal transduction histidine kinase